MKLSKEAQKIYDSIKKEYQVEDSAGMLLLMTVCESYDLMKRAEAEVKKTGIVVFDRYQQAKPNPATQVLRDSKSAMITALKALNLDYTKIEAI